MVSKVGQVSVATIISLLSPAREALRVQFQNEDDCAEAVAVLSEKGLLRTPIEFLLDNTLCLSSDAQREALVGRVSFQMKGEGP